VAFKVSRKKPKCVGIILKGGLRRVGRKKNGINLSWRELSKLLQVMKN
jgi:hypothetical protein